MSKVLRLKNVKNCRRSIRYSNFNLTRTHSQHDVEQKNCQKNLIEEAHKYQSITIFNMYKLGAKKKSNFNFARSNQFRRGKYKFRRAE